MKRLLSLVCSVVLLLPVFSAAYASAIHGDDAV